MDALAELSDLLSGRVRAIVVSEKELDLNGLHGENRFFVMKMVEGSLAAGGRGAGFGERRVTLVAAFRYRDGTCERMFETEEERLLASFEIPYYVSRLPFVLPDGTEAMGYGVVDPELVSDFSRRAGIDF